MRTLILPLFFLLTSASAFAQSVEQYMAPVWLHEEVPSFFVPYEVHAEPMNRFGALGVPIARDVAYYAIPVEKPALKAGESQSCEVYFGLTGLGSFLERAFSQSIELPENYAGGQIAFDMKRSESIFTVRDKKTGLKLVTYSRLTGAVPFGWANPIAQYSSPALSPDGMRLYFASSTAGVAGGWDIWYSERKEGAWGVPVNAGSMVNSMADETNPAFSVDGKLYFASNGHQPSFGGYDLYVIENGRRRQLEYPVNTRFDDLGIAFGSEKRIWVSSTRPRETLREAGPAQLYRLTPKSSLRSRTLHARTGKVMPNVAVRITNYRETGYTASDSLGNLEYYVSPGKRCDIRVAIADYDTIMYQNISADKPQPNILLTEKQYFMTTVQVMENGKACKRRPTVAIYKNDVRYDSLATDSTGTLIRDLEPGAAWRVRVHLSGYSAQEYTFSTPARGKSNNSRKFYFGLSEGMYARLTARDPQGITVSGVDLQVFEGNSPKAEYQPPLSNSQGVIGVLLPGENNFMMIGNRQDMLGYAFVKTGEVGQRIDTVEVELKMNPVEVGMAVMSFQAEIDPISLQAGKNPEMQAMLMFLEKNPKLSVELGVHTDARGNSTENLRRAKQAAEFAVDYFYLKGIARDRVKPKGYGESQPLNECRDGVDCSPEKHQANNRVEFRVLQH